jgi:hypothetical protein
MNSPARTERLSQWLFNPFRFVAGVGASAAGLVLHMLAAWHASATGIVYDGLLHVGLGTLGFARQLGGMLLGVVILVLLLWVAGKALSRSSFRFVDLLGTQLLARWPFLLMGLTLFHIPGYRELLEKLVSLPPNQIALALSADDLLLLTAVSVLPLACAAWTGVLMYRSFQVSCNVKGAWAIATFIGVFVIASALTARALRLTGIL